METVYFFSDYGLSKENFIIGKMMSEAPAYGDVISLKGKMYKVMKSEYDHEVWQSAREKIYYVVVKAI